MPQRPAASSNENFPTVLVPVLHTVFGHRGETSNVAQRERSQVSGLTTCNRSVATKLQDELHEKLPSVTEALHAGSDLTAQKSEITM